MDILTEIYRIKQVMGLITEQNDRSLVDENVYEAIKDIESKFSFTDKNGNIKGETYTGKEKESNIKKAIKDTIGLDYWFRIKPKLRGQIYSFMYQADSSENSLYRWLAGLAQSIDPNIERKNVFADKVLKRDANGNIMLDKYGKQIMEILPRDKLADDKKSNINKAIDTVKKAIDNDKINYLNYFNIVKDQYDKLKGTTNDEQNKIKIWAPRPEALDKLMSGESWPDVKAWWYNEIGETEPITQVNNASTQKDSIPANTDVVQPTVIQKQDSALANTVQSNIAAPAITTSQATQATLTQDSPPIDSELDRLETSGITDTGVVAPFTDKPYISSGNTIYNQRKQSSTLQSNPKLRRPWGDPYIYYSATTGAIYYHLCGKIKDQPGMPVVPCPKIPSDKWIKSDGINRTNAIKQKIFQSTTPNTEPENNRPEETTPENNINSKIKKAFRNEYYKQLINVLNEKIAGRGFNVTKNPCFNKYVSGCKNDYIYVLKKSDDNSKYYEINLNTTKIIKDGSEGSPIRIESLNAAMNKLVILTSSTSRGIKINGDIYQIRKTQADKIMKLSDVFDADATEPKHIKNEKVQNLNASKTYYIYKV